MPDPSISQSLRVAVVGCGPIGWRHAEAVVDSPDATLVAVCDPDAERCTELARRCGATGYADLESALAQANPNVVIIATPDHLHVEPTLCAIAAGCHVFCEKPLATSAAEARRVVETAEQAGVQLGVDYNRRYAFGYRTAHHALEHGILGALSYAVLRVTDRTPAAEVARTPEVIFTTLLTHHLDLLRWYGGAVASVHATAGERSPVGLLKSVSVTLRFTSGAVGTIVAGYRDQQTRTVEWLELGGSKGSITVEDITRRATLTTFNPDCARVLEPNPFAGGDAFYESLSEHLHAFLAHLARGEAAPVSGRDGLASLELAEAAIESLSTGKTIEMPTG